MQYNRIAILYNVIFSELEISHALLFQFQEYIIL